MHGAWFHARSDIDLAVEGIAPEFVWGAGGAMDYLQAAFEMDLIALNPRRSADEIAKGLEL